MKNPMQPHSPQQPPLPGQSDWQQQSNQQQYPAHQQNWQQQPPVLQQADYRQLGYQQPGYQQPGHQPSYQQPGHQPSYQQVGYQQSGYQPGYQQPPGSQYPNYEQQVGFSQNPYSRQDSRQDNSSLSFVRNLSLGILGILIALMALLPWMNFSFTDYNYEISLTMFDPLSADTFIDKMKEDMPSIMDAQFKRTFDNENFREEYYESGINLVPWIFIVPWAILALFFLINFVRVLLGKHSMRYCFIVMAIYSILIIAMIFGLDALAYSQISNADRGLIGPTIWLWIIPVLSIFGAILGGKKKPKPMR